MTRIFPSLSRLAILAGIMLLIGCGGLAPNPTSGSTTAPTIDLNIVRTEAAQTVVAQITQEAAANPTNTTAPTEIPPTETARPSPTEVQPLVVPPTETPMVVFTATATRKPVTFVPSPTSSYVDQATWISNTPADGAIFKPSTDFDAVWTLKNTGRRDWNKEFYYHWTGGNLKGALQDLYFINGPVKVNDTVKLIVDMIAPKEPGRYTTYWELVNDDGVGFFKFYLVIVVAN